MEGWIWGEATEEAESDGQKFELLLWRRLRWWGSGLLPHRAETGGTAAGSLRS